MIALTRDRKKFFVTIDTAPTQKTALTERLTSEYSPDATPDVVVACVESAWHALGYFGASADTEMLDLAERIAERELRLRLGLEREVARLDPEDHRRY